MNQVFETLQTLTIHELKIVQKIASDLIASRKHYTLTTEEKLDMSLEDIIQYDKLKNMLHNRKK